MKSSLDEAVEISARRSQRRAVVENNFQQCFILLITAFGHF